MIQYWDGKRYSDYEYFLSAIYLKLMLICRYEKIKREV